MIRLDCIADGKKKTILCREGERLLDLLKENGIHISAPCGGSGRCGGCRVIYNGVERRACSVYVSEEGLVEIPSDDFASANMSESGKADSAHRLGIAIDLGTTTIAMELLDIDKKRHIAQISQTNHQRVFGADVISRIDTAMQGHAAELKSVVQKDLAGGISELCRIADILMSDIDEIVISANTTMMHLLRGFDMKGLASYPFTPVSLDHAQQSAEEIFGTGCGMDAIVKLLPGISAFIGADIVSGVYALGMMDTDEATAMIDFGTNGEMAVSYNGQLFLASTAAGPAFEGGNISCGMGSVRGAISAFSFKDGIKTVGDAEPIGICGSGLIDIISELRRENIIDENGVYSEKYESKGFVVSEGKRRVKLTQADIHEFLLAKAAVSAGFDILTEKAGIREVDKLKLYLSGGFGTYMNVPNAAYIGLIDERLAKNAVPGGNSSLKGAVRFLTDRAGYEKMNEIIKNARLIELADTKEFNKRYIEEMRL